MEGSDRRRYSCSKLFFRCALRLSLWSAMADVFGWTVLRVLCLVFGGRGASVLPEKIVQFIMRGTKSGSAMFFKREMV